MRAVGSTSAGTRTLVKPIVSSTCTSTSCEALDHFATGSSGRKQTNKSWSHLALAAMKGMVVGSKGVLVAAVMLGGCASLPSAPVGLPLHAPHQTQVQCTIPAELHSWRVFGNGRHLRLDSLGGCGTRPFSVEYLDANAILPQEGVIGLGNTDASRRILPPGGEPGPERIEAEYQLTVEAATCISMVRIYEHPYELLGPNSSSALRAAMTECGIPLPEHIPGRGGMLSSYPGVDHDAGPLILKTPPETLGLHPIHDASS